MARLMSDTQVQVREQMLSSGQPMVRRRGGFWTYRGCANKPGDRWVPIWWVGVQTIRAMEKHGLLVRLHVHADEWRDSRGLPGVTYTAEQLQAEPGQDQQPD